VTCPRCGTVSPPTSEPLVHCATCKLSFDARAEPVQKRTRKRANTATEVEQGPAGTSLTREPGEWTIKIADQRIIGVASIVLGVCFGIVFFGVKGYEGQELRYMVALVGLAVAFVYIGLAKLVSRVAIHIDERQIVVIHEPLPLQRRVWIGRAEIQKVRAEETDGSGFGWQVVAETPRGPVRIAGIRGTGRRGGEAAAFVEAAIREGLEATGPEPTSN
jgi:hypothetical protein